jgi:hypothetical protein
VFEGTGREWEVDLSLKRTGTRTVLSDAWAGPPDREGREGDAKERKESQNNSHWSNSFNRPPDPPPAEFTWATGPRR